MGSTDCCCSWRAMGGLKGGKKDHEGAPLAPPCYLVAQVNSLVDDERGKQLDTKSSDSKATTTGGMKRKRCETVCTRYSDLEEAAMTDAEADSNQSASPPHPGGNTEKNPLFSTDVEPESASSSRPNHFITPRSKKSAQGGLASEARSTLISTVQENTRPETGRCSEDSVLLPSGTLRSGDDRKGHTGNAAPCSNGGYMSDITDSNDEGEHNDGRGGPRGGNGGGGDVILTAEGEESDEEDEEYNDDDDGTGTVLDVANDALHEPLANEHDGNDGDGDDDGDGKASDASCGAPTKAEATSPDGEEEAGNEGDDGNSEIEMDARETAGVGRCIYCDRDFPENDLDEHVLKCVYKPNDGSGAAAAGDNSEHGTDGRHNAGNTGVELGDIGEECPICSQRFPPHEIEVHANACIEMQKTHEEEMEKKARRAKRGARAVALNSRLGSDPAIGGGGGGRRRSPFDDSEKTACLRGGSKAMLEGNFRRRKGKEVELLTISEDVTAAQDTPGDEGDEDDNTEASGNMRVKGKGKAKMKELDKPGFTSGPRERVFQCPTKMRGCGSMSGCGADNTLDAQRCFACNQILWMPWSGGELRLGDEVLFFDSPETGVRGEERKITRGFVFSFENGGAKFTYKHYPGYLSRLPIPLADVHPLPPEVSNSSSSLNHEVNTSRAGASLKPTTPVKQGGDATSPENKRHKVEPSRSTVDEFPSDKPSREVSSSSSSSWPSSSPSSSGVSEPEKLVWGQNRCQHVMNDQRKNYNGGKCKECHRANSAWKAPKRPRSPANEEHGANHERSTDWIKCETSGCSNQALQSNYFLCDDCFARYQERLSRTKAAAAKKARRMEAHPPSCRACEGRVEDSPYAKAVEEVNRNISKTGSGGGTGSTRLGVCSACKQPGGRGKENQLLLCDGQLCPVSTHMKCLKEPLSKLPEKTWFCEMCVAEGDDVRSQRPCIKCGSPDNEDVAILCDFCNLPVHLNCLPVALEDVPNGDWFCPDCRKNGNTVSREHDSENPEEEEEEEEDKTPEEEEGEEEDKTPEEEEGEEDKTPEEEEEEEEEGKTLEEEEKGEEKTPEEEGEKTPEEEGEKTPEEEEEEEEGEKTPKKEVELIEVLESAEVEEQGDDALEANHEQLVPHKVRRVKPKRTYSHDAVSGEGTCDSPHCLFGSFRRRTSIASDQAPKQSSLSETNGNVFMTPATMRSPDAEVKSAEPAEPRSGLDGNRRWTCKSDLCQGRKSFHERCLVEQGNLSKSRMAEPLDTVDSVALEEFGRCDRSDRRSDRSDSLEAHTEDTKKSSAVDAPNGVRGSGGKRKSLSSVSDSETESENEESDESWEPGDVVAASELQRQRFMLGLVVDEATQEEADLPYSPTCRVQGLDPSGPAGRSRSRLGHVGNGIERRGWDVKDEGGSTRRGASLAGREIIVLDDEEQDDAADSGKGKMKMYTCPICDAGVVSAEQIANANIERKRFLTYKEVQERAFLRAFRERREGVEGRDGIKGSHKVNGKSCYMYGSICDEAVDFMFRECGLTSSDRFLDIGSGIGQVVAHAAAWAGCSSAGIEIVEQRHLYAVTLLAALKEEASKERYRRGGGPALYTDALNRVRLYKGNFVDMWDHVQDSNVIYLNNTSRWFKSRDPQKARDCFEAQLVKLLRNRLVTLITMETLDDIPMAWTRRELTFRSSPGQRVATYNAGPELTFYAYTTNPGNWRCGRCNMSNENDIDLCPCGARPHKDRPVGSRCPARLGRSTG